MDKRREHARGRIQGRQGHPCRVRQRLGQEPFSLGPTDRQGRPAPAQPAQEFVRLGPGAPGGSRDRLGVHIEFVEEAPTGRPAPPRARVHDLHDAPVAAPRHHKVRRPAGLSHHDKRRQGHGFRQEQMVHRHQDLLGVQPELHGNGFQHVNGGAIDIGLAGFPQAPVAHRQAMACQEGR